MISLFQGHVGGEVIEVLDVGLVEVGVVYGISMHHLPVAGLPLLAELVQDEVPGQGSHDGWLGAHDDTGTGTEEHVSHPWQGTKNRARTRAEVLVQYL